MPRMTWFLPMLAVAGLSSGCHATASGNVPASGRAVEQQLRELDRQWAELAVHGDPAAFDRLVTDDHLAIHANGKLVTNDEERKYLVTSPDHIAAITTDEVSIRRYDDTAVIRGIVIVKSHKGNTAAFRYTTIWLNRGDQWRVVAEQHTKIEPAAPSPAAAAPGSPEQVVRAYVEACNKLDLPALVALHSPDVRKYARKDDSSAPAPGKVAGELVMTTSGRDEVARKYERLFARTPRSVHVDVIGMLVLGDLVVSRDRVSGFDDGHVSEELALYEVRDGLIRTIWYLDQLK